MQTQQKIPKEAIESVVDHFSNHSPNDGIFNERRSFEKIGSRVRTASGEVQFQNTSERFPLLESVSRTGDISPYLSQQWQKTKSALIAASQHEWQEQH